MKILVDDEQLLYQSRSNDVGLVHLNELNGIFVEILWCCRGADYLVGLEILQNLVGLHAVVLVAFIDDDFELQTVVARRLDVLQKVFALALLQGVVALLGQFFPVDEAAVVFAESASHHVSEQLGLRIVNVLVHLGLALFLEVALARREPDENGFCDAFAILVHEVREHDGLAAARWAFQDDF